MQFDTYTTFVIRFQVKYRDYWMKRSLYFEWLVIVQSLIKNNLIKSKVHPLHIHLENNGSQTKVPLNFWFSTITVIISFIC